MTQKIYKKTYFFKLFPVVIAMVFSFPLQSSASVFDWFAGLKSDYVIEGLTVASSGSIYANSRFAQGDDNEVTGLLLISQGNSLVQSSGLSNVTRTSRVNSVAIRRIIRVMASAYSSTVDQTDGDPFTTANGTQVRDGIIATNILPFNTQVKIPDLYGDKIFTVTDRMNSRYQSHIDVWFPDRQTAINFGRKAVTIEIISSL